MTPYEKKVLGLLREIEKNTRPVSLTSGPERRSWGNLREFMDGEVLRGSELDN